MQEKYFIKGKDLEIHNENISNLLEIIVSKKIEIGNQLEVPIVDGTSFVIKGSFTIEKSKSLLEQENNISCYKGKEKVEQEIIKLKARKDTNKKDIGNFWFDKSKAIFGVDIKKTKKLNKDFLLNHLFYKKEDFYKNCSININKENPIFIVMYQDEITLPQLVSYRSLYGNLKNTKRLITPSKSVDGSATLSGVVERVQKVLDMLQMPEYQADNNYSEGGKLFVGLAFERI